MLLREVAIREVEEPRPVGLAQFVLRIAVVLDQVSDTRAREWFFIADDSRADQTA